MTEKVIEHFRPWVNWRRKRFWVLVALLAYTLAGFFLLPRLVENALVDAIAATGRSIEVTDVKSNPYALHLTVSGLEIRDPDSTPIARFDEFFINLQTSSLFRWAWTFADIRLTGLHIEEERFTDTDTRWVRFLNDLSPPPENQVTEEEEATPPRIVIHNLVLENGGIGITDQLAGGFESQLGPVSLTASDLRTIPGHGGLKEVSIGTPSGGVISWSGDLQLVPLASKGQLSVIGNGLPAVLQYADHFLPISIKGEHVEANLQYAFGSDADGFSFEATDINTKTGSIQVRMDNEETPFLALSGIAMSGGTARWPERAAHAESLTIDGIELTAWLEENGHLSLLNALPAGAGPDQGRTSAADPGLPEWSVAIDRVSVPDARVEFEDRSTGSPARVTVDDLDLDLAGVDIAPGTSIGTDLSLLLGSGGQVSYSGQMIVNPALELQGRTQVTEFELGLLQPWLERFARIQLDSGKAALDIQVTGTPPERMEMAGSASITELEIRDTTRNQRLAGLESLEIERFELNQSEMSVRTSPVAIKGAFGQIHIFEDLSTNIGNLVVEGQSDESADESDTADPAELSVTIAGVGFEDSSLDFADDSLPLPFQALIRNLDGSLSVLSNTTAEPTRVDLEGQVNEFGQARISGALNPWDFTQSSDIDMIFRNLEMSDLTPYTIQYAGYAIESGRMDLDLGYVIDNRQLAGENKIVIRELALGDKIEHPDAASLPLKLAVALLKDSEGVIDLDLPVSGDMDDPTFKISGIVWKAIGNLITRIVTSPFRFLGNLIGIDSEDFGTLRFQPGSAEVSPPDREQLTRLSEAMQQRPQLALLVTGVYAPELDRPALQEKAFEEQLEATRAMLLETGEADVLAADRPALESLFATAFPDLLLETVQSEFTTVSEEEPPVLDEPAYLEALRTRLIESQTVDDQALEALAAARAGAVAEQMASTEGAQGRVTVATEVASGESEDSQVLLELEVSVGDAQPPTE